MSYLDPSRLDFVKKVFNWFTPYFSNEVALFIACQSSLESNFGTSRLATDYFNYFGMKSPVRRLSNNLKPCSSFAHYADFDASCIDYLLWCSWGHIGLGSRVYVADFKNKLRDLKYCPTSGYLDDIQKLYDIYEKPILSTLNY